MLEAQRVAVNIAATNALAALPNCLESLDAQTDRGFTITIVDNASTDGTIAWLQDRRADIVVLRNFRNQQFSRAQNQAIAFSKSRWAEEDLTRRYILVMAPDVELAPTALEALVAEMEADLGIAVAGPKVLNSKVTGIREDGAREIERLSVIRSCGLFISKSRRVIQRGRGETDHGQYDASADVFGISSVCALYRVSALLDVETKDEIFDEDFGGALTDADLAWRMKRQGFRARFVSAAVAWKHIGIPERATVESVRNAFWLVWKNDEWVNRLMCAPWIFLAALADIGRALISPPRLKGFFVALPGWFRIRTKRAASLSKVVVQGEKMRRFFV
jgi:GT2 family glycosyltransferase